MFVFWKIEEKVIELFNFVNEWCFDVEVMGEIVKLLEEEIK